jgi:hypothetical protein
MRSVPRPAKTPPESHSVTSPGFGAVRTRGDPPETNGALREFPFPRRALLAELHLH